MALVMWDPTWANPVLSLTERDRRHAAVRRLMRRDGIDVVCCLPWTSRRDASQGDSRYLTQLGENSDETTVAFSHERVTAWHSRGGAWPSSSWLDEVRAAPAPRGAGGRCIVDWLREHDLDRCRLAVAGLDGGPLNRPLSLDGEVNWASIELISKELPGLSLVSGTALMGEARFSKSDEEIATLRVGRSIAAEVIETIARSAHSGASEREVWAAVLYTYADLGGSFEPSISWSIVPAGSADGRAGARSGRPFGTGDLITVDIWGRWCGYGARLERTLRVGPDRAEVCPVDDGCAQAFRDACAAMKPGTTIGDVFRAAAPVGYSRPSRIIEIQGCGVGGDGPSATSLSADASTTSVVLVENAVLSVSCTSDGNAEAVTPGGRWGDTVVVTSGGAVPLASSL